MVERNRPRAKPLRGEKTKQTRQSKTLSPEFAYFLQTSWEKAAMDVSSNEDKLAHSAGISILPGRVNAGLPALA